MNTDKTMESRLNSILWKNTDPADTSARPMRKELADELLSFLESELAIREQEIVASIRERAYAGTKNTDIQGEAIADIAADTKGEAWELGYEAGIETAITIITKKD